MTGKGSSKAGEGSAVAEEFRLFILFNHHTTFASVLLSHR